MNDHDKALNNTHFVLFVCVESENRNYIWSWN